MFVIGVFVIFVLYVVVVLVVFDVLISCVDYGMIVIG